MGVLNQSVWAAGLSSKEESASRMGMAALTSDMASQRWALRASFLEAEAAAAARLAEVDALRAAVEGACAIRLPAGPAQQVLYYPLIGNP